MFSYLQSTYPNDFYSALAVFVVLALVAVYLVAVFLHMGLEILNTGRHITGQLAALIAEQKLTREAIERQRQ